MPRLGFRLPSPAMVVALVSLIVALGGTSYAVVNLPKDSVGTKQLKKKAVTAPKVRANAITSPKVKDRSLLRRDFKKGHLPSGPGNALFATQSGLATLANPAAQAKLATVSLPAGSYTFSAQAFAFQQGPNGSADQVMCSIRTGTNVIAALPTQTTIEPSSNLIIVGATTLEAPATVDLNCSQITPPPGYADTLGIIGGRLLATRVGKLTTAP